MGRMDVGALAWRPVPGRRHRKSRLTRAGCPAEAVSVLRAEVSPRAQWIHRKRSGRTRFFVVSRRGRKHGGDSSCSGALSRTETGSARPLTAVLAEIGERTARAGLGGGSSSKAGVGPATTHRGRWDPWSELGAQIAHRVVSASSIAPSPVARPPTSQASPPVRPGQRQAPVGGHAAVLGCVVASDGNVKGWGRGQGWE